MVLHQLDQMDEELNLLLKQLKRYNDDQLNRPPKKGGWSVIQIMRHLMLSEKYSLAYIKKKSQDPSQLKKIDLKSRMRSASLQLYLRFPMKRKAPEMVAELPEYSTFWETAKQWKEQRAELRQFIGDLPKDIYKTQLYKHPGLGRISLSNMLQFFFQHFKRHNRQIRRIIKQFVPQTS